MLLTGAAMSQTRLNIIQLRESWTGMGISETIQYTDACHAILFQQFNCAAAFGNQAVVQTISNTHPECGADKQFLKIIQIFLHMINFRSAG